jgi:hypothetical protein
MPMPMVLRQKRGSQELAFVPLDDGSSTASFQPFPAPHLPPLSTPNMPSNVKRDYYMGVEVITGSIPPVYKGYQPKNDIEEVYRACAGLGTRNNKLIKALAPLVSDIQFGCRYGILILVVCSELYEHASIAIAIYGSSSKGTRRSIKERKFR